MGQFVAFASAALRESRAQGFSRAIGTPHGGATVRLHLFSGFRTQLTRYRASGGGAAIRFAPTG
jgi:hypothetical protein